MIKSPLDLFLIKFTLDLHVIQAPLDLLLIKFTLDLFLIKLPWICT